MNDPESIQHFIEFSLPNNHKIVPITSVYDLLRSGSPKFFNDPPLRCLLISIVKIKTVSQLHPIPTGIACNGTILQITREQKSKPVAILCPPSGVALVKREQPMDDCR